MISMITDLLSLGKIAANSTGVIQEGANAVIQNRAAIAKLTGKAQSIASLAKKRINEYPVVISNAFGDDIDAAFKIARYAESAFAYFMLITIGMEPVVEKGNTISMHISQYGSESLFEKVEAVFNEAISSEQAIQYEMIYKEDQKEYKMARDFVQFNVTSREDITDRIHSNNQYERIEVITEHGTGRFYDRKTGREVDGNGAFLDEHGAVILDNQGRPVMSSDFTEGRVETLTGLASDDLTHNLHKSITDKFNKSLPTTFTVNLYVGQHKIPITLAVKAVPHFISSDEMQSIFKRCIDNGKLLSRLIRLKSGEISFFKDFILNLKQIEEDQKMYSKLERHPWWRLIQDRKTKSNIKGITSLIGSMNKFMTDSNILPTISLVTTANEISTAMSYPYLDAVKTGKVEKVLNKLMLLGLFVYDQDREIVYCHFNGIKAPYVIRLKDLTGKEKDSMDKFAEVMQTFMIKTYS